jgi:hypothetical protein
MAAAHRHVVGQSRGVQQQRWSRRMSNGRGTGAKRTPAELDALVKKLHAHVVKNPGQRIEKIGAGLGIPTKERALPARKLLSEKRLATKGQKRATLYFAN